ncbi:unknown protein [Microcystis aeruginosa NIES-843]|uniref:Uncharacterized protein n=1 Tax=Microcystis aeruginosa (strain NIES-843 / IAM M-2473) TaxID=449447 RepID=B0JPG3_MICAN|nr:unknown protein [Microcystis aeruginosa NIES-843]
MLRSRVASALRPPNLLWARLLQWGLILIILQAVLVSDRIKIMTQSIKSIIILNPLSNAQKTGFSEKPVFYSCKRQKGE